MKQSIKMARIAREPKLVFDGSHYMITKVPHNYRIFVKYTLKKNVPNNGIDRDCYSSLDDRIEKAHKVAQECIEDHFVMAG